MHIRVMTTGPISVTTSGGSVVSPRDFVVTSLHDFSLSANPVQVTAAAGSAVSWSVEVTGDGGMSALVSLAVSGLPDGFSGFFSPVAITSGQSSTLILTTCDCLLAGPAAITITGTTTMEGRTATRSASVLLELLPPARTAPATHFMALSGSEPI
ncbi:MAG: hypothetical protein ABFD97_24520 [Syntrophobacter sp.]